MRAAHLFLLLTMLILNSCSCESRLSQLKQWVGVKEITEDLDQQLGDIFWESYSAEMVEVKDLKAVEPIQQMVRKLCSSNGINTESIQVHVVENKEINAFAMPGRHLVVHTGLIQFADHKEEIAG
ncbi:MAG: hypothetical protein RL131_97, partial [Bacteroidota bacterium]